MSEDKILIEIISRSEQIAEIAKSIQASRIRSEKDELRPLWYLRVNKQKLHIKTLVLPALQEAIKQI